MSASGAAQMGRAAAAGSHAWQRAALSAVLLLALGVRLFRLDGQSLWYDEGNSVALAGRDVFTIIQSAARDIHPPLYYIVLHAWVSVLGNSEVAVRLLSALLGVALVYVTYLMGRRLFGLPAALVAAFLAALSPFQVYYSQEARMYIGATLLGALSVLLLLELLDERPRSQRRRGAVWLGYVLVTVAGLYFHYFAATVVLAQDAALAILLARRLRGGAGQRLARRLLPIAAGQGLVALLYWPWLPVMAMQFSNWPAISELYSLPQLVARLFPIFSLGLSVQPEAATWLLVLFAALLGIGCVASLPRPGAAGEAATGHTGGLTLALCWLATPVLVMFALSLRRPLYNPKFLLVATPAFYLLLGRGAAWLASRSRPGIGKGAAAGLSLALLALLAAGSAFSLTAYYFDGQYARDNYRGLVRTIEAGARPGDGILLNAPGQADIFDYYYHGPLPRYTLPRQRPMDVADTEQQLQQLAGRQQRLWVVYYGDLQADPQRAIESWLDSRSFKASDRWFGDVRLALYALPLAQGQGMQQALNISAGDGIGLLGYTLGASTATGGDIVPLTLFWQVERTPRARYTVFAHIIDADNQLWGQRDSEPAGGLRPTNTWQGGERIQDNYGLPVLPGTPPGDYQIELGLYEASTGQRLALTSSNGQALGDHILIGPIRITTPVVPLPTAALGMDKAAPAVFSGGLRLLGYSAGRLGDARSADTLTPQDVLQLTLFWQAPDHALPDYRLALSLGDVTLAAGALVGGRRPTSAWAAQEVVRQQLTLPLAGAAPGQRRLQVEISAPDGAPRGVAVLGSLTIK